MTPEQIAAWAREAGCWAMPMDQVPSSQKHNEAILRFAALVAAHVRERCAKVCDELADDPHVVLNVATVCAENIRLLLPRNAQQQEGQV